MDITSEKNRIEIFCCYSRQDQPLLIDLKKHLKLWERQGLITIWADTDISPGTDWEKEITQHLSTALIILFLVSPDFLASDYCDSTEMTYAMERFERGEVSIIPIILRHCAWKDAPFGKLQVLPTGACPVTDRRWQNLDEAFTDVAQGIQMVVKELRSQRENVRQRQPSEQSQRREVSLSSSVTLLDASLDPHDSPYKQTIEQGRKTIRYKGQSQKEED